MNRVNRVLVCLSVTLLCPGILASSFSPASAQLPAGMRRKPFVDFHAPMPKEVMQKPLRNRTRAATPQTVDLTPNTPTVTDSNPSWSKSANAIGESPIVFQSNRADLPGLTAGATFHVYQMDASGQSLTALTGPLSTNAIGGTNAQTEPAMSASGDTVVYIDAPSGGGGPDLVELNLQNATPRSLTKNNPNGFNFIALNHPEYGPTPTGNLGVVFAGQVSGQPYHLYAVDTQSGQVAQLTFGGSDDRDPTTSPDPLKPVIAFDRAATPNGRRDIFVIGINPSIQNAKQVTNFSAGGAQADNRQPAWSTNKVDQATGTQPIVRGQQLLAFASTRMDSKNDGNADAINPNGSHDIYWLKVDVDVDITNPSVYTVYNPTDVGPTGKHTGSPPPEDAATNPGHKLTTSDPQHVYDDLHPAWPQFITTYRVAYQTNRTSYSPGSGTSSPPSATTDIFASTLIDLNAPTLVRFNTITGDVVDVTPRISPPGSKVTISAKLADLETGIRDVWIQIKNPNSKYQGADGKEHKVYALYDLSASGGTTTGLIHNVPEEYEMQPIDPSTYAYQLANTGPKYLPGNQDFFAFSGSSNPPDTIWLQLQPVAGSRDADGTVTYRTTWQTDNFPSDYVIDLIAYDNALNPFSTNAGDTGNNWKIYDNVWGFSTQTFQAQHNVLVVSDYSAGQKFFNSRFGISVPTNVFNTFWGTESWLTDYDVNLFPIETNDATPTFIFNWENTLGVASYSDAKTNDGTVRDGRPVPATQQYDIWRILCRGPVPDSVLAQYTPVNIQQPPDVLAGEKTARTLLKAPRAVLWNSPFSGDLFTGAGSITDLSVQTQLHNFLAVGGRLIITGQDIAWALTLDGSVANSFVTNDLKVATYSGDTFLNTLTRITLPSSRGRFPVALQLTGELALVTTGQPDPITWDPFGVNGHNFPNPTTPWVPLSAESPQQYLGFVTPTTLYDCCSFAAVFPDHVIPIATASTDLQWTGNTDAALYHYQDAALKSRVVYAPAGWEGFSDKFDSPLIRPTRAWLMHDSLCWIRTGSIVGQVLDTDSGVPLPDVEIRLFQGNAITGAAAYTGVTKSDGTFQIDGVERGTYQITGFKPGYVIQKATFVTTHGGFRDQTAFKMTKAQPDTIIGQVTTTDGTTPVVGATVTATDNNPLPGQTAAKFTAVTDANGNYRIERVPSQTTYTLTASAPGYGASIPLSYLVNDTKDPSGQNLLQPATTYGPYNFQLKATPGSLEGFVYQKLANGNQGPAIPNATVTATKGTTVVTTTTDANGHYIFDANATPSTGLDPGTYSIVATAPGYAPNVAVTAVVVSAQSTTAPVILLSTVAPGSISGLVTRTSDNSALAGVLIQLKDAAGNLITSTTTTTLQTDADGYKFNYRISSVPAGVTYTVTASKTGFTSNPTSQTAAVATGVETKNVNFQMEPLHTFPAALTLVSAPYDYGSNAANVEQLLSVPNGDPAFLFATWNSGAYVFFPNPPADKFRLGRGYFLGYKTPLPLSIQGVPADDTRPFDISLTNGWNLIGDPFLFTMDFTKATIIDNGVVETYDQARTAGIISPALYSYVSGTYVLDFTIAPWQGYWLHAYKPGLVLRLDPNSRAVPLPNSRAILQGGDGWSLNLRASVADVHDDSNYLGVSSRAANGFDGNKIEKPPVFGSRYVNLTFDHQDWGTRSGQYGVDVRSASTTNQSWTVNVQTNVAKSTGTLTWPNIATIGRAESLTLTDLATGAVRDMRSSGSYTWGTGDNPAAASRVFRIDRTRAAMNGQLRVTSVAGHMLNRGPAASSLSIDYNLSGTANVEIRVVGAQGQTVRHVTAGATRAAGINQATWDLRNDQGVPVPSGTYTVEVKAQSADGRSSARQITAVTIVR